MRGIKDAGKSLVSLAYVNYFYIVYRSWIMGIKQCPFLRPCYQRKHEFDYNQVRGPNDELLCGYDRNGICLFFFFNGLSVKISLLVGLCLIGGFVLLAGVQTHYIWLMFTLALAGSGYGLINPAINKGIVAWFPHSIRGTAMSLKQIGVMLGSIVSAVILPSLALQKSIGFALIVTGSTIVTIGIMSYFVYVEKSISYDQNVREKPYRANWIILSDRNLLLCNIIGMLLVGAQFSFFMYLSLYMREQFHYDVIRAGIVLSIASIGGIFGRLTWGMTSDFFFHGQRKNSLIFIGLSSTLFALVLAWIPANASFAIISSIVFVYGTTIAGWNGLFQAMVVELAEPQLAGIISGITLSFIYLGTMIVPFLFGVSIGVIGNYRISWSISALTVLVATIMLFKVEERPLRKS